MAAPVRSVEKVVEKAVVRWARDNGWLVWKIWAFNQVGVPDRIFIHHWPVIVFIEFKREGGRMGPLQERTQKELALRGFPCYTVFQVENGIQLLKDALGSQGLSEKGNPLAP
jgi:hypothetical protein